jgi:hypothetical protein
VKSAVLFTGLLAVSSCVVETTDSRPVVVGADTGLLVVDWSISGYQDPALCRQSDADLINIHIETADGDSVGEFEDVCEAFSTSIELVPGDYFAEAVLLDPSGSVRTTAVDLGLIDILGNDELVVPIDFPPDSFF